MTFCDENLFLPGAYLDDCVHHCMSGQVSLHSFLFSGHDTSIIFVWHLVVSLTVQQVLERLWFVTFTYSTILKGEKLSLVRYLPMINSWISSFIFYQTFLLMWLLLQLFYQVSTMFLNLEAMHFFFFGSIALLFRLGFSISRGWGCRKREIEKWPII